MLHVASSPLKNRCGYYFYFIFFSLKRSPEFEHLIFIIRSSLVVWGSVGYKMTMEWKLRATMTFPLEEQPWMLLVRISFLVNHRSTTALNNFDFLISIISSGDILI